MYKLFKTFMLSLVALAFSNIAVADINDDLQNICTIVKNNDKSELRKKMRSVKKDYNLRLGDYYSGISCGGSSLIRYAMENASVDVGEYMIKKMSKGDLTVAEKDGQTLQQWAEANGHMGSPLGAALQERLN